MKQNTLADKLEMIKKFFTNHSEVAVAFSGGVDSAVLLMLAKRYAKRVKAYFVKSQFQPRFELDDAIKITEFLNAETQVINVDILAFENIAANPKNRCYFCKQQVFKAITEKARSDGFYVILDGTNASDDISDRPGYKALQELKVLSPLKECGLTKAEIRQLAKENELFVFNKPSYACLATRIPSGTAIKSDMLIITEKAENEMRNMGFKNIRLRYMDGDAKIELGKSDFDLFFKNKDSVYSALKKYYNNVYLDLKERADE